MIYGNIKNVLNKLVPRTQRQKRTLVAILLVGGGSTVIFKWYSNKKQHQQQARALAIKSAGAVSTKKKVAVDRVFFRRLYQIIRIVMPGLASKEFMHLVILTGLLFARTILSIKVADVMGNNARHLVEVNYNAVKWGIITFFWLSIPASFVNSALKYETDMLSLRFRRRLTTHVHDEYLTGTNFYKASHLGGANRIDNADQRVTDDIEKFCSSLSNLYANIFKPVLDVVLFTRKLTTVVGFSGPLMMYGYYLFSSLLLRSIMPPFPKLVARESELEGDFRTAHQRLITNAEEICFYGGSVREKTIINNLFSSIYKHSSNVNYLKLLVGVFDGMLVKYGASIIGYGVMCLPVFFGTGKKGEDKSASGLTRDYVRNTQLLINLARAIGSLVLIYKRITSLAGYTSRVSELLEMVRHLNKSGRTPFAIKVDHDDKKSVASEQSEHITKEEYDAGIEAIKVWLDDWRRRGELLRQARAKNAPPRSTTTTEGLDLNKIAASTLTSGTGGKLLDGEYIKFVDVSIVSPEGKLLVSGLNFEVKPGLNVMISGPNGSGKSSLFRVLGELWPLHCGVLVKPPKEDIFYVPQKPYLVLGTLRDQIIYPHSHKDMLDNGVTDDDLEKLMEVVDPSKTMLKQWRWNETKDWFLAMSGGQKQRIAMARLFYHRPRYAILDECTSAVSSEVEGKIYETCAKLGITLFTVSHRVSLRKYHDYELAFDGEGGWSFNTIAEK